MVFYRIYRPKTLAELDNRAVADKIGKYLESISIPHAFIFIGPKGTGKTSTARILAKSLNCPTSKGKKSACGKCLVCESIATGDNLDVLEIDAASNRGIDDIRELREKIKLVPISLPYKVYIIDEVHMLTTEAFNALLKTLEEPPSHTVFVLATTEPHKVPETIISRCIRVDFHRATAEELIHALKRITVGEHMTIPDDVLAEVAGAADGSFRDAAKLLEEILLENKKPSLLQVREKLGLSEYLLIDDFMEKLDQKDAKELLILLDKLETEGKNIRQFFLNVITKLEKKLLGCVSQPNKGKQMELLRLLRMLSRAFSELKFAVLPALPFELALVEYCETTSVTPGDSTNISPTDTSSPTATSSLSQDSSVLPLSGKWEAFINSLKSYNHSIAGVVRSCRWVSLKDGILTLEAAYKFHGERLTEPKVRDILAKAVKDVIGLDVAIEVVIKKRN